MSIIAIAGSPSPRSRSNALLAQVCRLLAQQGHRSEWLGLDEVPAEDLIQGRYASPAAAGLRQRLAAAPAVLIATPVYKASFAGGLKALLDLLDQHALAGKVVLPLASGGSPAHLLALEYSLKPVLSALGARHILSGVYATESQVQIDADGQAQFEPALAERLAQAADTLASVLPVHAAPADFGALARGFHLAV